MPRPVVPPAPPPGWGIVDPPTPVLRLGRHTFEVADEAVVVGRLAHGSVNRDDGSYDADPDDLLRSARRSLAEGAAALEVPLPADVAAAASAVERLVDALNRPVIVASDDLRCIEAALVAGAAGVIPTARLSTVQLVSGGALGATLLLMAGAGPEVDRAAVAALAGDAVDAGLATERLLVEVATAGTTPRAPGLPVVVSDPSGPHALDGSPSGRARRSAAFALGIAAGGRLVRTTDPRTARRTAVALAAVRRGRAAHLGSPA
ncbi:MAG: hypothetical protein ACLGI8_07475 [Acidimicrobiia bacterium]